MLPALNDIFERLLSGQMYEFYNGLLSDFLSAYRKFYSCETSLLRLTEDGRMMRDRGELVAVVSMDLSKELRELKLETPFRPGKASSVGSRRGVC